MSKVIENISKENLNKIQILFEANGFKSEIQENFVLVQDKNFWYNQGKKYEHSKAVKINKVHNAISFIRGRV